jgi:phosphoribosylglycinamide formyltransferase-1
VKRVAILISGGGSNMLALARAMTGDFPARPCLVLSNDPGAGGLARAADMGIPTAAVDHKPFGRDREAFQAALLGPLLATQPDVICLAGFMRILTPGFVQHFENRLVNIHPSLLPAFTGLNTHQRAIDMGCKFAGATVHRVTAELDHGDILDQAVVPVLPGDTAQALAGRVLVQEHLMYPRAIERLFASAT